MYMTCLCRPFAIATTCALAKVDTELWGLGRSSEPLRLVDVHGVTAHFVAVAL